MRAARLLGLLLTGLLLFRVGAGPSFAQKAPVITLAPADGTPLVEPPPVGAQMTPTDAKAAQVRASQLFHEGHYPEAADMLRLAYLGDPRPILLFNAGQAYRKAELPAPAKEMYEQFLKVAPDHALAPETRGYVKDMEALMLTQERAQKSAREAQTAQAAAQASAQEAERKRSEAQQAQSELEKTQAQLQTLRKPLYRRASFWAAMGTIAASVILAGAIGGFVIDRTRTDGGTVDISR